MYKRRKRQIITFDETERREYVTGFRKRKQERRRIAKQQAEKLEKEEKRAEKKMRRAVLKNTIRQASGVVDKYDDEEDDPFRTQKQLHQLAPGEEEKRSTLVVKKFRDLLEASGEIVEDQNISEEESSEYIEPKKDSNKEIEYVGKRSRAVVSVSIPTSSVDETMKSTQQQLEYETSSTSNTESTSVPIANEVIKGRKKNTHMGAKTRAGGGRRRWDKRAARKAMKRNKRTQKRDR